MRERLDEAFAASEGRPPSTDLESMRSAPSMASQALKTLVVLGGVCMLAYLLLGRLLPRLLRVPTAVAPRHIIQVVDRLPVDQKRSVMVLKLHDLHFLVGITEHGISLLSRLEAEDVRAAIETAGETSRGTGLRGWIGRRPEKET